MGSQLSSRNTGEIDAKGDFGTFDYWSSMRTVAFTFVYYFYRNLK